MLFYRSVETSELPRLTDKDQDSVPGNLGSLTQAVKTGESDNIQIWLRGSWCCVHERLLRPVVGGKITRIMVPPISPLGVSGRLGA